MSFCSFSGEYNRNNNTVIDNKFLNDYLPEATGDAVKVYVYGLFVCNGEDDVSIEKFAENLKLDEDAVKDCFKYWEEFGLVDVISSDPLLVKYLPINAFKPKKFKPEKYTEFNKSLQVLIPERMITTSEFSAYFSVMEEYSVKPEAMLMIVKYCVDLKGSSVPFKYVLKVASDFAARGITTTQKIEKELSAYTLRTGDLADIANVVSPDKKPDVEDGNLYKKWTEEFGFTKEAVIFAAKKSKAKSFIKLDKELLSLYSAKRFDNSEINSYYDDKSRITDLAYRINRELSVYKSVIEPVVENYVYPWINKGYDEDALIFIANYCFKKNRCSLEEMNDTVDNLYKKGLVTLNSIVEYIKTSTIEDNFIKEIISTAGLSRKPTEWDRENLKTWRGWNFSDEMILEAAKLSQGKNIAYINAVLSAWKSQGVYSVEQIPTSASKSGNKANKISTFDIQTHKYTKEELDSLIVGIDDLEF